MSTRRKLVIVLGCVVALLLCAIVLLHSNAIQEPVFSTILKAIERDTGWVVDIENPRLRLWPARLVADGVTVSVGGRQIASIENLAAHWSWAAVLGSPRRIDECAIHGLEIDLREPVLLTSSEKVEGETPVDPWRVLEIGRLRITDSRGSAGVLDFLGEIDGLRADADLVNGRASVTLTADRVNLERLDRHLDLGSASLRARGSAEGVSVDELTFEDGDLEFNGRGELSLIDGEPAEVEFRVRTDLSRAMNWWDPNVASGLEPSGVIDLEGRASLSEDGEIEATAIHRGERLMLVGYALDELELRLRNGISEISAVGVPWGEVIVAVDPSGVAEVRGELRHAPVERVLAFVAPEVANVLEGPVSLTGEIEGTASYPFTLETLSGRVDLAVDSTRGRATLKAEGAGDRWRVGEARVDVVGASISGEGELRSGGAFDSILDLRVDDGTALETLLVEWIPDLEIPDLRGGPLAAHVRASGSLEHPQFEAELEWISPVVMDYEMETIAARVAGGMESADFSAAITVADGAEVLADGTLDLGTLQTTGSWDLDLDNLHRFATLVEEASAAADELTGSVIGSGTFALDAKLWSAEGSLRASDIGYGDWRGEEIRAFFSLDPEVFVLHKLTVSAFGGTAVGSGEVGLGGLGSILSANLEWGGIATESLPIESSLIGAGAISGRVDIKGTIANPTGRIDLDWKPSDEGSSLPELKMAGGLEDGVLKFITEEVTTDAGALWAQGEIPLGLLPRPDWMWPEAPERALRISASGHGLQTDPVAELLGYEGPPVSATADLELEASWYPKRPNDTRVLAELRDFRLRHLGGEVTADRPVVLTVSGDRVEVEPVVLSGTETRVALEGAANLTTREISGSIDAILAPRFARNIPYPVQIHEPIKVEATVGGTTESPRLGLTVNHPGGALVFRDPPLRIRDLVLSAEVVDGVLWINDGRARVNQGTMEIGGGWDPVSRQGIVAEIENVVVFVGGILSQWSGAIAIEPQPERLARVVGELNLVAGLWDQNISLGGALFGSNSFEPTSDDPLNDISLDMDVRGRGIVRVENNLGRFDARWDVLRVTGRAARPRLNGEITIDPGGRFSLAGQRVTVRRGSLLFTGDPDVDPIVEIVPESDVAVFGGGEGEFNTSAMATQGLVEGLAGALGFENETLQPAEISVETEKETSENLMLGQRISHNVALFFATNTTDVQDRTSMLQFWNLPGLKGLAIQGYEKTLTEELGGNVVQRFQWGGSSLYEDRPTIRKLKLTGEWPLGKRGLRKSTGFRRGQPFDPFLEFVARVRMERKLAGAGYQEAQVQAESVESNNAWTLNFECDPGPFQEVVFSGDVPPRRIREEVTALYRHPPLESFGFGRMASLLDRHFNVEGYPDASIVIERRGDLVVAEISRQGLTELSGPILDGVPKSVTEAVVKRLGNPSELALLAGDEERAIAIIERVLGDQGYRKAAVRSVETVATSAERAEIRAVVDLGAQSVVGEIVITGTDPLGLTDADSFPLRVGSPLDRLAVDLAASQLRAGYDAAGFSDAVVRGSAEESPDGVWRVTVDVEPGLQRVLEGVEVTGLRHTSPRSILSGMTIEEGEILRNSDLDATAVRVANFAPIERVDVRTIPQGSTGAKVELDVIEKKRWTTEIGAGWSSERGAQARFGLRDDNLLGRGFSLNLRGRWDQVEWLGFVVASLPPLPGKKLSFTSTIGYSRGEPPDGDSDLLQDEASWSIQGTRWLGGGERATGHAGEQVSGYYRFTRTHTYDKVPPDFIWDEIDINLDIGLVGARYVRDRFDYPFDPTSGYGLLLDVGYSDDFLASDVDYWTALANGSVATGIFGSTTWMQSVRVGATVPLGDQVLFDEIKFFAGGQGSVRGFDRNTVGPITYSTGEGFEPAGGGALFILNEELRIPVWKGLRAAVFADIGQVWESWGQADFRLSVGAGIGVRWATPVGPLWADIAWPVVNTGISSTKPKFYVGIGRPF